jgi:hypothetical protein
MRDLPEANVESLGEAAVSSFGQPQEREREFDIHS